MEEKVPAEHGWHAVAPVVAEKVPAAQSSHPLPAYVAAVPGGQLVHCEPPLAPEPATHATHAATVDEPADGDAEPTGHATQDVAPSALVV